MAAANRKPNEAGRGKCKALVKYIELDSATPNHWCRALPGCVHAVLCRPDAQLAGPRAIESSMVERTQQSR